MTSSENYPKQYEDWLTVKYGKKIFIRPITLTDEKLVVDFFDKLSPETIYMRFLTQFKTLPDFLLQRFIRVNYTSEFALIAVIKEDGKDGIIAIARYGCLPEENITDFGITVRDDWQHFGIGTVLLKKLFAIARENGIFCCEGVVHPNNETMIKTLSGLGYDMKYSIEGGLLKVQIKVDL